MGVIVTLVLIGVGLIIIFPIFQSIAAYVSGAGDSSVCSLSLVGGQNKARCPIQEVTILPDKVTLRKTGETKTTDMKLSATDTSTRSKEAIGKLLKSCLDRGGGYNSHAFSRENIGDTERVCLQCYTLILKDTPPITNLVGYLSTAKRTEKTTYLEDLTRDAEHKRSYLLYGILYGMVPSTNEPDLRPDTSYTIIFLGNKKGKIPTGVEQAKAWVEMEFLRAFLMNNDAYYAFLVESSKISEPCQRLVN